jgi:hypothetical protein
MSSEPDFDRFCERLESLRDQVPPCRSREGLTARIMAAIHKDKKAHFRRELKEMAKPIAIATALFLLWFFFRPSTGRNTSAHGLL